MIPLPNFVKIPKPTMGLPNQHLYPITDVLLEFTHLAKGDWDRELIRGFRDASPPFSCAVLECLKKVQEDLDEVYIFIPSEQEEPPQWVVAPKFQEEPAFQGEGQEGFHEDTLLFRYEAQFSMRPSCDPWYFPHEAKGPQLPSPWPQINIFGKCSMLQFTPDSYLDDHYTMRTNPEAQSGSSSHPHLLTFLEKMLI